MNPSNEIEAKTRGVERYLYRLGDNIEKYARGHDEELEERNFQLDIYEAGVWVIKFRSPHSILINNAETIITDGLKIDATIGFTSSGSFWATVNGNLSLDSAAANFTGDAEALRYYKRKIFSSVEKSSGHSVESTKTLNRAYISNTRAEDEAMTTRPLKAGWMLKKKEIMRGWNSRYFKVYVGRFEYFMDPNDENPRAVIPLLDAKVSALPKEIRLRGYDMHYQIMIEPKYHEKSFRLASERGGSHGKDEIESWQTAFDIASKPADIAASLIKAAREKKKLMLDESDGVTDVGDASGRNDIHRVNDAASGANERTNGSHFPIVTAVRRLGASAMILKGGKGGVPIYLPVAGVVGMLVVISMAVYQGHIKVEKGGGGTTWLALFVAALAAGLLGSRLASGVLQEPSTRHTSKQANKALRSPTGLGAGRGRSPRKQKISATPRKVAMTPTGKLSVDTIGSTGSRGYELDNVWDSPSKASSPPSPSSPDPTIWRDVNI